MSPWISERPETSLDEPRTIPELLDVELARRRISERQAAVYIGVSANAVNKWHLGVQTPKPEYCRMIATWLRVPEEDILRLAGHLSRPEETEGSAPVPEVDQRVKGIGSIEPGGVADIVLIDPERAWTVDTARMASKGRNTPLQGATLTGRVRAVIFGGEVRWEGEQDHD